MTYKICWTCHLPKPTIQSPIGEVGDPQHNCIEALQDEIAKLEAVKQEVAILRRLVKIDLNRIGRESTEPHVSRVRPENLLPSNAIRDGSDVAL